MSEPYRMSTRRKLVIASWTRPTEGNIFGKLDIDATAAERYVDHLRRTTGEKVTVTHLVGKASALAMAKARGLNGRILFGRYVPHDTVDITFLVALEDGSNLAKAKVPDTDKKSVVEIARELGAMGERLRRGEDDQFKKSQGPLHLLPTWIIRPILWLTGWLTGALGIEMRIFGLERFPFGSLVITNVGMFGLEEGYAPQTPFARVPVWILVGVVKKKPVVVDDQIVIRPILPLMATLDHRFVDGAQLGTLAKILRDGLEQPWTLDGLDRPPW
jgi:pyruvate dehydrogenase E2 component (dihydrolipoamide acetyltransferase)